MSSGPFVMNTEQQIVQAIVMSVGMLAVVIKLVKLFKPGKNEPLPMWVGMQYAYCMALGTASPEHLDNDRYPGIRWTGADEVVRRALEAATTAGKG